MLEERSSTKSFLLGVVAGGVVGSLIALLYAPKSGKRLRRDIIDKKDEMIGDAEHYIEATKAKASKLISDGKKKAEAMIDDAVKRAEQISKKAESMYKSNKNNSDELLDEVSGYLHSKK